jgi:hypothetical protein|tara:strand:- start:4705 stop:5850 length:1146 start_codon:yes stop_codon:yes gene_type:complete
MADSMFFSRDSKVFVAPLNTAGAEVAGAIWEIPVLDGFSFSQATNTSEVTLNEMSAGSNVSRRGRKMFTDSYAPAEWSFSTYVRPFKSADGYVAFGAAAADKHSAVEEVLWAMMAGQAQYTVPDVTPTEAAWGDAITKGDADMDIVFTASNKTTLGKANIYFQLGGASAESTITYKISNCCINEAGIDFDIDGIATINWSGMGTLITEQAAPPTVTRKEAIGSTGNFIRNRLTELVAVSAVSGSSITYALTLTGGSITISNNMTFLTPETLGVINQPLDHVTGTRSVSGSFTCYLSNASNGSMDLWEDLIGATGIVTNSADLTFKIGGAGNTPRVEFDMPACHLEVPTHSIDDIISVEMNFHALGTDIESADELAIKYVGA